MNSGIVVTVNLLGSFSGPVKHTTTQSNTVELVNKDGRKVSITKEILHTDRPRKRCVKQISIPPSVVRFWEKSECPYWESVRDWKKYKPSQKITSYVGRYDEGYGVSYE